MRIVNLRCIGPFMILLEVRRYKKSGKEMEEKELTRSGKGRNPAVGIVEELQVSEGLVAGVQSLGSLISIAATARA